MGKWFFIILALISLVVLTLGVALAEDRRVVNPTLEECRALPKFEGLFEGDIPDWKIKRNRKCMEMERKLKKDLEEVKTSLKK